MNHNIVKINLSLDPIRKEIINHKLYQAITTIEDLRLFMEFHVYAVFDFMSLLKGLQRNLTCINIPWVPIGNAENRFLINEIVVGEESDIDFYGARKSHFEMYLDAMNQAKANTLKIDALLDKIKAGENIQSALNSSHTPQKAFEFVEFTFDTLKENKAHVLASVFTFGREDLIPSMFYSMVSDLDTINPNQISLFKYYLERHIEVDGGHHSLLALQMVESLCANDDKLWSEAEEIAISALQKRLGLWDAIYDELKLKK